eukprot:COSAG02_NODE_382_length_23409_cov_45.812999_13_plen_49_part_00
MNSSVGTMDRMEIGIDATSLNESHLTSADGNWNAGMDRFRRRGSGLNP